MYQLLQLGYNVIQSDGDALWLQNAMFEFNHLIQSHDIVVSRGKISFAGPAGACVYHVPVQM